MVENKDDLVVWCYYKVSDNEGDNEAFVALILLVMMYHFIRFWWDVETRWGGEKGWWWGGGGGGDGEMWEWG